MNTFPNLPEAAAMAMASSSNSELFSPCLCFAWNLEVLKLSIPEQRVGLSDATDVWGL